MATKNKPGNYDCYKNAEPDEPLFTLLARDVHAPFLLRAWADVREAAGEAPTKVEEARSCASAMERWNTKNRGRKPMADQAVYELFMQGPTASGFSDELSAASLAELGLDDDDLPTSSKETSARPIEKSTPAGSSAVAAAQPAVAAPAGAQVLGKVAVATVATPATAKGPVGSTAAAPATATGANGPAAGSPAGPPAPDPKRVIRSMDLTHTLIAGIASEFSMRNVGSNERRFRPVIARCDVKERGMITITELSVGGQWLTFDDEKQTVTQPDAYDFCRSGPGGTGLRSPVVTGNSNVKMGCRYSGQVPDGMKPGDPLPFRFALQGEAV